MVGGRATGRTAWTASSLSFGSVDIALAASLQLRCENVLTNRYTDTQRIRSGGPSRCRQTKVASPLAGPDGVVRQTALVTGAASGIGAACASRFLAEGWRVVGWDVRPGADPDIEWVSVDVSDWDAVAAAASQAPGPPCGRELRRHRPADAHHGDEPRRLGSHAGHQSQRRVLHRQAPAPGPGARRRACWSRSPR